MNTFVIADVIRPILGIDFLQKFKMSVDLHRRRLLHSGMATLFTSTTGQLTGVNVIDNISARALGLLKRFPEVTDTSKATTAKNHSAECFIETVGPPVRMAPRKLPTEKLKTAQQYFQLMCQAGICRRSNSPWSSGLHMVPKKDGTWRPCGDYRRLNNATVRDSYPLPHLHEFAANIQGSKVFSKVDLVKGYHQILMHAPDIPKTAITMPFGLFEFVRMPFGLKNAAQAFQRMMDSVTQNLPGIFVYLDDVLVAFRSEEQHEQHLQGLFQVLSKFGLVINQQKCGFGVTELEFLGHMVSADRIRPLPEKVDAIQRFSQPQSLKSLQRFLGLVNFYRRFLPNAAGVLRPLTDALAGGAKQLRWTQPMEAAFEEIKTNIATATLLAHPRADAQLYLHTDASMKAIASAVHQMDGNELQPLAFFSRRTSAAEAKYSAYDLDLLAVYSSIIKFRHMLEGRRVKIFTDQKPLTSAFFKVNDPVSNRQRNQLAFISEFVTDIAHIPGKDNVVADALSRQHDDSCEEATVSAIAHLLADIDLDRLALDQRPDPVGQSGHSLRLQEVKFPGVETPVWCDSSKGTARIVVPQPWTRKIFYAVHNLAYPSAKATLAIISQSYVWPNMRKDVHAWTKACTPCARSKVARHTVQPVTPIETPASRFEHVHVDVIGPFPQEQGMKYILTIMDRTTRWPEAVPMPDAKSDNVIRALVGGWISRYGVPRTVTTDRGAQFTSDAWRRSMSQLGIEASTTTAYHPQANGLVEWFHRSLKNALRCAVTTSESWTRSLPWVQLRLRNALRSDTAASAAEVIYSTPLRVPGLCFQQQVAKESTAELQLQKARDKVSKYTPIVLNMKKFKQTPFIPATLRKAKFVFIRDDTLAKKPLVPRYSGPFKVLHKDWHNYTFLLNMGHKQDTVSASRLKAASLGS